MSELTFKLDSSDLIESITRLSEQLEAFSENLAKSATSGDTTPGLALAGKRTETQDDGWIEETTIGFDLLTNQLDRTVRGVIFGTERISTAFAKMGVSIGLDLAKAGLQMAASSLFKQLASASPFQAMQSSWKAALQGMSTDVGNWVSRITQIFHAMTPAFEVVVKGVNSIWDTISSGAGAASNIVTSVLHSQVLKEAASAAAGAFSWVMQTVPPPFSFALAPAAAAAAFAGTMALAAFDVGGIVPRDMLAMVHQGEIVVPTRFADLMRSGELGGASGGDVHVHIGSISTNTPMDLRRELDRFADKIGDIVQDQHRAGRYLRTRY